MKKSLLTIAGPASYTQIFNQAVRELGFSSSGEIERFVFNTYKETIRSIKNADRPRGVIFILEPASVAGEIGAPSDLKPLLNQIKSTTISTLYSLCIDLNGGLKKAYTYTTEDKNFRVSDAWPQKVAQSLSQGSNKCVVWAAGINVHVYINGFLCLDTPDILEELPAGLPAEFQGLSWEDGEICFQFADCDLNDRGPTGIWHLPEIHLLRPKPEVIIRSRLGKFLQYRLAGYYHHDEEPLVENEGCADISLHLSNGRVMIVEVKWIGCALVGTRIGETKDAIKKAIAINAKTWLTKYDETTITKGVRQLVRYYKTNKYRRAYLAVFDCDPSAKINSHYIVPVPVTELDGHDAENFRILRACVDPRSASRRARS